MPDWVEVNLIPKPHGRRRNWYRDTYESFRDSDARKCQVLLSKEEKLVRDVFNSFRILSNMNLKDRIKVSVVDNTIYMEKY